MSGIAIKITSLIIRTVSKPIANSIKAQAREHEGFRRICVGWAQYLHRVDMRLRLGLLNDPAKIERQIAADAARKKREASIPTVKTEAQTKADEEAVTSPPQAHQPKIKPLSESKAIDMGANFIAESFLFAVAVGTLFFDQYRSRKKETSRRNDVAEKLAELEERDALKNKRMDDLEAQLSDLKGHHPSWQWPWKRDASAASAPDHSSRVTTADAKSHETEQQTVLATSPPPDTMAIDQNSEAGANALKGNKTNNETGNDVMDEKTD